MIELPAHLKANEKAAIGELIARVLRQPELNVVDMRLFGSKARGDFDPDSDLDILIILENADWTVRDQIHLLAARVSLEYDVLINTHLFSRAGWENMTHRRATLWRHVQCDGIPLMPERLPA